MTKLAKNEDWTLMRAWKNVYVNTIMDELLPKGDVLEVGFGQGDAAEVIQSKKPKSHTIIEKDPEILKNAREWAKEFSNVKIIEGDWKKILPTLGKFDTIFFGNYAEENEADMIKYLNVEEASFTSAQAKEALKSIEDQLSKVKIKYSDKEIEDFYEKTGKNKPEELETFFKNLKDNGFITKKQYDDSVKKYNIQSDSSPQKKENSSLNSIELSFIQECVNNHMKPNSRLSAYLSNTNSNYENTEFFDSIITNQNLNYEEKLIPIQLPNFKPREALIIILQSS